MSKALPSFVAPFFAARDGADAERRAVGRAWRLSAIPLLCIACLTLFLARRSASHA